jgi:hypothetical protein
VVISALAHGSAGTGGADVTEANAALQHGPIRANDGAGISKMLTCRSHDM